MSETPISQTVQLLKCFAATAIVVSVLITNLIGCGGSSSANGRHTKLVPDPGDTVILIGASGSGRAGAARTVEAFQELEKVVQANDEQGLRELAANDVIFLVNNGTKAKFIDYGSGWSAPFEVRIINGDHAGEKAFIDRNFIAK